MRSLALAIIAILGAGAAFAEDFQLSFPVACTLGQDCFIQKYVDRDATEGYADFGCGHLSSDNHRGTDIALHDLVAMEAGVAVLAASSGSVKATRDGMPDISARDPNAPDVTDRNCGNAVILAHPNGWETWYCHLKRGSVLVRTGDTVARGDPIGEIGLSGLTEFPHVHMTVRKDGNVVDPFQPNGGATCGGDGNSLWVDGIPYDGGGLITAGFSNAIPDYADIKAGTAHMPDLGIDAGALVLWVYAYGGRAGDVFEMAIDGPNGAFLEKAVVLDANKAQLFRAVGRKGKPQGWQPGIYRGYVQHIRDDIVIDQIEADVFIAQ